MSQRHKSKLVTVEHIRNEVLRLIKKHEPHKADAINVLMKKYKRNETYVLKYLCDKFQEEYKDMKPIKLLDIYSIGPKIATENHYVTRKLRRRSDNKRFLIKILNKKRLDTDILDNEINILRQLSHPNITNIHDIAESRNKLCLIMDGCEGGELFDYIKINGTLSEKYVKKVFVEACSALQYIHSDMCKDITYRNIKLERIFISSPLPHRYSSIKLHFDFGDCRKDQWLNYEPVNCPQLVAPEILNMGPYNIQADMWSIGVGLYTMLFGFSPFDEERYDSTRLIRTGINLFGSSSYSLTYDSTRLAFLHLTRSVAFTNLSTVGKDLLMKLLEIDPNKRLTPKMALRHQWIAHQNLTALISGYIRIQEKYDSLLTFSTETICDFAVFLFVGYFDAI